VWVAGKYRSWYSVESESSRKLHRRARLHVLSLNKCHLSMVSLFLLASFLILAGLRLLLLGGRLLIVSLRADALED